MAHTFGGAFVCQDKDSAVKVTFDKQVSYHSLMLLLICLDRVDIMFSHK